ncbi:MAG: ferritin, partial [Ktedonobacteraceae bacterium]
HELYSSYFYLSASGYLDSMNFSGFARWMRVQYQEEVVHAMKFFDFMLDRGSRPILQAIDKPPANFQSPLDAFTQALQQERQVTALIHSLYALTVQEKDYPAQVLLQWFISEQVEEEKTVSQIVEELKMAGDNSSTLLLLNSTVGSQRNTPATEGVTSL